MAYYCFTPITHQYFFTNYPSTHPYQKKHGWTMLSFTKDFFIWGMRIYGDLGITLW